MTNAFWRRDNADLVKKLDAEALEVAGVLVHQLRVQPHQPAYTLLFDDDGLGTAYIGRATPGSLASAPAWELRKLLTSGNNIEILWAEGSGLFDKVWDARLSYTYS